MNLAYKKIEEKDKDQLFKLIETVLEGLEDKEYFIPYEQWEYDSMFDEKNYAPLYGAYDGDKLAGMAQLYVSQEMLADFKKEFELEEYQVCELGGNLVLPEYRGNGITTKLQTIELNLAKELGFDIFGTTLTVSPHKWTLIINKVGKEIEEKCGILYLEESFKKKDGYLRSINLSKELSLYRQNYCGCRFSIRREN